MIWLELDPNIVKPGWTPLLILIALAVVMVLLFRSMRRQFRRVDDFFPGEPVDGDQAGGGIDPASGTAVPGQGPAAPVEDDPARRA